MLKKRVIFTLLFNDGSFMLSRNFRLQKVGDISWLQKNYDFSNVAFSIDELIVLDTTRGTKKTDDFCEALKKLTEGCFIPIAAGGGVKSVADARSLMLSGADKIVLNTSLYDRRELVGELASEIGRQSIVASVDAFRNKDGECKAVTENGSRTLSGTLRENLEKLPSDFFGELYLNSINRDGTGQGYDLPLLDHVPGNYTVPVIISGGAGNFNHFAEGLRCPRVDAVATAHLFNFVGTGLENARKALIDLNFDLALWEKPHPRHCEERSDEAISKREIASPLRGSQ